MTYRKEVLDSYHSILYQAHMPDSPTLWEWVLKRIDENFGAEIRSLPLDGRILDLPCGVGYVEHVLLRRGFVSIDAVDGSKEQVEVAQSKLPPDSGSAGRVQFHVSDAAQFLKNARGYAAIFMIDFVEHLAKEDLVKLLRLARESLAPDGIILLRTPNAETPMFGRFYNDLSHETPLTRSSLRQCMHLAGYSVRRVDFEVVGYFDKEPPALIKRVKRSIHRRLMALLGRILGVPEGGFSENIICVAKR